MASKALRSVPAERAGCLAKSQARPKKAPTRSSARAKAQSTQQNVSEPGKRSYYSPATYAELLRDAAQAAEKAISEAGHKRVEVEFPSVPGSSAGYTESSDSVIDANVSYALALAKSMGNRRVQILLPDSVELDRAASKSEATLSQVENASLGCLVAANPMKKLVGSVLGGKAKEREEAARQETERADTFIAINLSTQELPSLESFAEEVAKDRPVVALNLELETLRGDLGLPAFPGKDLHFRFLSQFFPAFYLRQRTYSRTISSNPFIVSYSGALFREYPGKWQVMLRQDSGELCCIAESGNRYPLGEVREELTRAMGLLGDERQESVRQGYKSRTWWEEGIGEEESAAWRS